MKPTRGRLGTRALCALAILTFAAASARATTFRRQVTFVDLVGQSELILRGTVKNVTDGIDSKGLPYTEVTLRVSEAIKGGAGAEYRFRQFGLLKPRPMGDGRTNLMVTPAAWATYKPGEETILFLYKASARTGLRTTAGLGHGKFTIGVTGATNQFNNAGLFSGVQVDPTLVDATDQRVMATPAGALNTQAFVGLVKKAVSGRWVEKGAMKNAKK